jgi:hypothetical protein
VIILPVAALFVAAALNFALPHNVPAMAAVLGALLSGIVCFHALLDVHWLDP